MENTDQYRVLIVDDDKLVRDLIKDLLQNFGATVVGEAENGEEALQAFDEYKPDVTFLDIEMPVKNGIDALKDILAKDPNANVIMLTATSDMDVVDMCAEIGAQSFIRKGAAPAALNTMLKAGIDKIKAA